MSGRRWADAPAQVGREEQPIRARGDLRRPRRSISSYRSSSGAAASCAAAGVVELVAEPAQRQPAPGDIGQRVPQPGDDRVHGQQSAVLLVGDEAVGAAGQHRGRPGRVEQHARRARSPRPARWRPCRPPRRRWACRRQAKIARRPARVTSPITCHGSTIRGSFSISMPNRSHSSADQVAGLGIAETGEVDEGVIHKGLVGLQSGHAPGHVARRA